ncbi:MAG: biotin--[acetyl-CoA-carboxylase] ligase [Candidatus Kapabacteria bacterium]|nr:biotin--[acetyl-CoA-carboxylase] ligase [Candidatus Kapabacteria bacterium]
MAGAIQIHLDQVTSTNDVAKEFLRDVDRVVVTADHQTSGRGRRGRDWYDAPGQSVLFSFGFRNESDRPTRDLAADMARGCLAVMATLRLYGHADQFRCKYPNDVQGRDVNGWSKLAGILVEHEFVGSHCQSTIIGIGINVLQESFPETIGQPTTSLMRLGISREPKQVASDLRTNIEHFQMIDVDRVYSHWREELKVGHRVLKLPEDDSLWQMIDVDEIGRLVVMNNGDKTKRIIDNGDSIRYVD